MHLERLDTKTISRYLGIRRRSVQRIIATVHSDQKIISNKSQRRGSPRKMTDDCIQFILGLVQQRPDMYLDEIRAELLAGMGVLVSLSTIHRSLRKAGLTMKEVTKAAREQDIDRQAEYFNRISR